MIAPYIKPIVVLASLGVIAVVLNSKIQFVQTGKGSDRGVLPSETVVLEKNRFMPTYLSVGVEQEVVISNKDLVDVILLLQLSDKTILKTEIVRASTQKPLVFDQKGDYVLSVKDVPQIAVRVKVE